MFSSWFNPNQNQNQQPLFNTKQNQLNIDDLVNQILRAVRKRLSQQVGQDIPEDALNQIKNQVSSARRLQDSLIQTKRQYHQLVLKVTNFQSGAKKIASCVSSFIQSINEHLNSQEMLIPLRQIEKGISQMAIDKVEKQFNYLKKIYSSSFQEIFQAKVQSRQVQYSDQINLLKTLNKNIESEFASVKNAKLAIQKKNSQLSFRIAEISEKYQQLSSQMESKDIESQTQLKQRYKNKENEYIEQIKNLEKQKVKLQQKLSESQNQNTKTTTLLQKIKTKDQQLMEQMRVQTKRKQSMFQQTIKKIQADKLHLQDTVQTLKEQIEAGQNMRKEIELELTKKNKQIFDISKVKDLQNKIRDLESLNKNFVQEQQKQIGREIMKQMFLRYDDQSKQWSIRKDIRRQIYGLLEIQIKEPQNGANGQTKWFGFF